MIDKTSLSEILGESVSSYRFLSSFIALAFATLALWGCEGDIGLTGHKGEKGRKGVGGSDPEHVAPAPRYMFLGVTNGSMRALVATDMQYVTFDTTLTPNSDTIVASKLNVPPLLDGLDGGPDEWGNRKSVLRLSPQVLNSADDIAPDPHIYKATCRVGYDDDFIFVFLQWKEKTVASNPLGGTANLIVSSGESKAENTLFLDVSHPDVIKHTDDGQTKIDTVFSNLRVHQVVTFDSVCYPPPPLPPIICDYKYDSTYETLLVWKVLERWEDKAIVGWGMGKSDAISELPRWALSLDTSYKVSKTADEMIDIWRWGAGTSEPANVADDWSIQSGRVIPDYGDAPYLVNWILPDSIPRYMRRLDPNYATSDNLWDWNIPLWYFDAVPYRSQGWTMVSIAYAAGTIAEIPSFSRSDIVAHGTFADDVWTIEFKRARKTGNGDDLQF
jgi:hypothetical protein